MTEWLWVAFWLTLIIGGTIVFMVIVLGYAYGGQSFPGLGTIPPPEVPPARHDYPDLGSDPAIAKPENRLEYHD